MQRILDKSLLEQNTSTASFIESHSRSASIILMLKGKTWWYRAWRVKGVETPLWEGLGATVSNPFLAYSTTSKVSSIGTFCTKTNTFHMQALQNISPATTLKTSVIKRDLVQFPCHVSLIAALLEVVTISSINHLYTNQDYHQMLGIRPKILSSRVTLMPRSPWLFN
jgi:hypothetical protein